MFTFFQYLSLCDLHFSIYFNNLRFSSFLIIYINQTKIINYIFTHLLLITYKTIYKLK